MTRVYAADYELFDPLTGKHLRRDTWIASCPQSSVRHKFFGADADRAWKSAPKG